MTGSSGFSLDAATIAAWADVVDDHNPLHLDPEFAARTRFGTPIVHGSLLFALACDALQTSGTPGAVTLRFRAPVPVGSTVSVTVDGAHLRLRRGDAEPVEAHVGPEATS
ncbi:MaoC family dehydratase [Amycolatopsis sp. FDAARGOS 1241]|uniref:MaoC family dehydratase n=1 Tax=Amycolatopsis sp. FDAARGOS 1241 TaxID=2778070 RepID=UPI00194FB732|nr:MaoC family dehydratase [Amycolatopsis sp. FDAARGOS 1241]QRP43128.1 MaoC family dehydratase [Amycolatopsis sp. FDAARGOS 1241]